ncbi:MAM and LDL-receptor class A domain-containing protein 2 (Fragment) [Anthophora plagiata]
MKISWSMPFLLLTVFAQCVVCHLLGQSRCPIMKLENGRVRTRGRGRIIRFSCYDRFTLVGNRYSTCIRGQWDTPTPVCVNAECTVPPLPEHALMSLKYNGAILIYFCEPGYTLIGSAEIFCDGRQWNGTTPYCRDTTASAPTQCDFEKPDLCWWEQDPRHDFDWRRHNFETPSFHIGTGPTHDHTLGPGNDGYYLYIEASGRLINDTARIISPIYNASYTDSGCFSFWYHMFGATMGTLNIYFKPEKDLVPRLMFKKEGDQGNQWLHGMFNLPKAEKGFQIIIEGVRGEGYVSDIAIDDLAILQGDKCRSVEETETEWTTERYEDQVEVVNAQQSCRGRCKNNMTYSFTTSMTPMQSEVCLCTLDCAEYSICCPDYAEYCVLAYTDEWTTAMAESNASNHDAIGSVPPVKSGTETDIATVRTGFSINPKDDIDPVTLRPYTMVTTTNKPVTTTTNKPITTTTNKPVTTTTNKLVTKTTIRPVTTVVGSVTNTIKQKIEKPTLKTTRQTTPAVSTTKTVVQTKETSFVQQSTVARRYERVDEQPDSNARGQDPEKIHRGSSKFSSPGIIGIVVGILTGVSISLLVGIIILRRRKTYKRGTNGSALSEDSDVRFLTSDEMLDFTLVRPGDHDET